ncbi:hypothetical protein THI4931_48680 [Pandoraea sputorum]|nr:hypothetical protein THI4931_48680 [Pandoraea sputorum]
MVELLKHHHPVDAWFRDGSPVKHDLTARRLDETADGLEQRRFAAARGTEKHETVGVIDIERYVAYTRDMATPRTKLDIELTHLENTLAEDFSWGRGNVGITVRWPQGL